MNRLTPARLSMVMFMVVGGLIAAYIAKGLLAVEEKKAAGSPTRNVPMAISDLPAGTLVTEAHLGIGPALNSKITRDVLLTNKVIIGRFTKEPIKAAEPILSSQLFEKGNAPPLKMKKGMRAVTISLGTTAIVDGLIKPGQYVDVHFSPSNMQSDPRIGKGMTMTLFRGVKILTINRLFNQSGVGSGQNGENSVTLELSEGQANIILVARDKGILYFSYNPEGQGNGDLAVTGKDRITLEEILGLDPVPQPAPPPPPAMTQIYRGLNMKQYTFTKVGNKMMQSGTAVIGGTSSQTVPNTGANAGPQQPPQQQSPVTPPAPGIDAAPAPLDPSSPGSPDDPQGQQPPVPLERSI